MVASPEVIGCERHHADHAPNPIVCETVREESSMTAIVLDHEQSHEETRGWHREQHAEPIINIKGCPHQKPEQTKRPDRDCELNNAARRARSAITTKTL